jgi:histidinol phosphatase-like enzyme
MGKMSLQTLEAMNRVLLERLGGDSGLRKVYFAPMMVHQCLCRKPQPGMILQAREGGVDLKQSL